MKTNSMKNLESFLYEKGITSDKLSDRAKSPEEVKRILKKIITRFGAEHKLIRKFENEFKMFLKFLEKKIQNYWRPVKIGNIRFYMP
jgi:hypothetical protein